MNDLEKAQLIGTVFNWITPILTFVVGAWVRSILKKVEKVEQIDLLAQKLSGLEVIKDEWVEIKLELTRLIVKIEHVQKSGEEITIIQRDMKTLWKQLDELREKVSNLSGH